MPFKRGFLVSLLLVSILMGATATRADLIWGVNGHPFTAYPGVSINQQLNYIQDLGMRSYRVNISSAEFAPALAELISEAKPLGIEILPLITPALDLDHETADNLYIKAYDLAVTLVSRFKDDIRVWELGNEVENYAIIKPCEVQDDGVQYNCAWGPAGGTGVMDYYGPRWAKVSAVLKGLSDGTIAVDPTIRKAMGTAGWGHFGAFARMQQDGIKWDISVWHHYEGDPEGALKILAQFNRPIWVTEFNHPGGSESGEQQQADGLTRMMMWLRQHQHAYNVEAAHVYELMDETYWAPSFEAVMGLVRLVKDHHGAWTPGGPKPAYYAAKKLIENGNKASRPRAAPISTATPPLTPRATIVHRSCDPSPLKRLESSQGQQVWYSYCLILGRAADGGGYANYVAALKQGLTMSQLLLAILESDEFDRKYSLSSLGNAEFVTLLYGLLLEREPDGGGFSSYVSQLDRGLLSRADLQRAIIQSSEFQSNHPILFPAAVQRNDR